MSGLAFAPPSFAQDSPALSVTRLANGLTVAVQKDDRFPLVSLRLYVHAGSAYETPDEAGISHLLEHMVFKGTKTRPQGTVAEDIEKDGGYINASTSFDYTVYHTDMPAAQWKKGLDVLKDMAFNASLDPKALEAEKKVVIAELKRGEDSPESRLFKSLQAQTLAGTPYARPIIGYENTINSFTSDKMRAYIKRLYEPQAMLLLICGNVDVNDALAEAQRQFGGLKNDHPLPGLDLRAEAPLKNAPSINVEKGPWNKVYLGISFPAPGQQSAEAPQLDVLAQLLGGDKTSLFYREYKYNKRLVDSISVGNYSFEQRGMFYISAVLDADKLPEFWSDFTQDLAKLANVNFTQQELDRAKLNLRDDLYRSKETLGGLASKIGYFQFFDNGEQGEANYLSLVNSTDANILKRSIQTVLRPEALSASILLPENGPADTQQSLGAELRKNWPAAPGQARAGHQAVENAKTETIDLGNGRTLILMPDSTLPYVSADLVFTGGDSLVSPEQQGLASLSASLLTKGAGKYSATDIEDFQADRAASLSAGTGRQSFSLGLNAPKQFIGDMFGLLDEVLTNPTFSDEELSRVRQSQIAAIKSREDQPLGLAFRRVFPFLFGNAHPYGYLQLGTPQGLEGFTAQAVRDFWQKQRSQPWTLAVCGDFDRQAIIDAAKKLPEPGSAKMEVRTPDWGTTKELDLNLPGRNQAHLLMIFPTAPFGAPDEAGLDLLQAVLSGQGGLLFRDLRDKQSLGYTVTAIPWQTQKAGALILYIGTEPGKLEQARQGFDRVIKEIQAKPLSNQELDRGKNQLRGDYYREHQSLGSRSGEAAALSITGRPLDAERELVERAGKITPKELQALAQKYLTPDKAYIAIVKP